MTSEEATRRDWAGLPWNVLYSVLTRVPSLQDYLRFSSVCKPWKSAAESDNRGRIATGHNQPPLLLVPTQDRSRESRALYSAAAAAGNKLIVPNLNLPVPHHHRISCCGSSHGWLAFTELDYSVTLYNPFTRAQIRLPRFKTMPEFVADPAVIHPRIRNLPEFPADPCFPYYMVKKVVLSADPSVFPDDYVAAALVGGNGSLAVVRAGEKEWRHVTAWAADHCCRDNNPYRDAMYLLMFGLLRDVVFHGGGGGSMIYTTGDSGLLARVNLALLELELELVVPPWFPDRLLNRVDAYRYLVESSDGRDLFMVVRLDERMMGLGDRSCITTKDFKVFKLHQETTSRLLRFVEVADLQGDAVFVGDNNHSTAVLASAAGGGGCKPDSIYYTYDFTWVFPLGLGRHDMGVFSVKDKEISSHYVPTPAQNLGMPPPIWILPTVPPQLEFN
ncbi:unnamed protein product [Linum trigynum]|uniref:F-box domain-containing protein n=1 Tax=Linum trigynum TaxID=586398 RepID=A0AAV2G2L5_9ROSI